VERSLPHSYLPTINWLLTALHCHGQSYRGHLIVIIFPAINRKFFDTTIGQGSLLILPLTCLLKAVFLVNSRPSRFYVISLSETLFIANLQSHFAEFLKVPYANTLVFSTCSLESVLVQFYNLYYFLSVVNNGVHKDLIDF